MRKPKDYDHHNAELRFINRVSSPIVAESFNNDWDCFAEYCNMQARFADDDGFPLIAEDMRNIRDTVNPHYRTEHGITENMRDFAPNLKV